MPDTPIDQLFASLVNFNRSLRAHSPLSTSPLPGLTRGDIVALGIIADEGPCRASLLSERMGVGPSAVSRLVAALHQQGLVERQPDPADGRAELLQLTSSGRAAGRRARRAYLDALTTRFAGWEPARVQGACELLDDLATTFAGADQGDDKDPS